MFPTIRLGESNHKITCDRGRAHRRRGEVADDVGVACACEHTVSDAQDADAFHRLHETVCVDAAAWASRWLSSPVPGSDLSRSSIPSAQAAGRKMKLGFDALVSATAVTRLS